MIAVSAPHSLNNDVSVSHSCGKASLYTHAATSAARMRWAVWEGREERREDRAAASPLHSKRTHKHTQG